MDKKLTDCLPVVKHAKQKGTQVKGDVDQRQPGGGKAKRKTLHCEIQDTGGASSSKPDVLEKLVKFDLDWNFGPCTGITRMERWQRAQDLGLIPPQEIKQILLAHKSDSQYQQNLWSTYAI